MAMPGLSITILRSRDTHRGYSPRALRSGDVIMRCGRVIRAVKVRTMADHKFKIGQAVLFRPKLQLTLTPLNGRPCRVIQILPAMNGEAHYRIRSVQTEHEIAASESELRPLQGYATP